MHAPTTTLVLLPVLLSLVACAPGAAAPPVAKSTPTGATAAALEGVRSHRLTVRWADAGEVASILREVFDVPRSREVRAVLRVPGRNEIVVVGTEAGIARVVGMLKPDVAAAAEDQGVEVLALQHAEAGRLVAAVERVAPEDAELVADEPTNSIVVQGSAESRRRVLELARRLDRPGS